MRQFKSIFPFIIVLLMSLLSSCATLISNEQGPALIKNVNVDETIKIARDEIKKRDMAQGLAIWVLRDQIVTPKQAAIIGELYMSEIDNMTSEFNIWHASWAIANLYRLGNDSVKLVLEIPYQKAKIQPERLEGDFKGAAEDHINGAKLTTGFIHFGGQAYAYGHLVVPGNEKYVQSYEEYLQQEKDK